MSHGRLMLGLLVLLGVGCERRGAPVASHRASSTAPAPVAAASAKPPPPSGTWDGRTLRSYEDPTTGLVFAIPASGYQITADHYPADTPTSKFRDAFTLRGPSGPAVSIEVFVEAGGLPLVSWFEERFGFMRESGAVLEDGVAGSGGVEAIRVTLPPSPQSATQSATVFQLGSLGVRVRCHDIDDPASLAAYELLLDSIGPRSAPPVALPRPAAPASSDAPARRAR